MSKCSKRKEDKELMDNEFALEDLTKYRIDPKNEAKYNETMRELLNRTIDIKEAGERGEDGGLDEATSIIQKANKVLQKSKCSSTAYLDAQILHTNALIFKNELEKMDSEFSEFKANEFADRILAYISAKPLGWKSLGDEAYLMFQSAPGCSWLLGAIDVEERQVPQRVRTTARERVADVPLKQPDKVNCLEKGDEDLEMFMQIGMKLIMKWEKSNKEPLQFWHLVLHPQSFSETVENIYIVSHLVKEKLVYVGLDKDGLPVIKSIRKESTGSSSISNNSSNSTNNAVAVTIDPAQWEAMVKVFEVKEPMFPTRGKRTSVIRPAAENS